LRKVRRKSSDSSIKPYLLKAKNEGIKLSWDHYEGMLPQDGFGSLGLYCSDCLQGPCRLNPFAREEERTVCGMTKEELVYHGMHKMIAEYKDGFAEADSLSCGCDDKTGLVSAAQRYMTKLRGLSSSETTQEVCWQVGLGVLKEAYVNICVEGISTELLQMVEALAQELEAEATSNGAKGYNIVLSGNLNATHPYPAVSNTGGAEFAILTGLVDLYLVGMDGLGLGKNVTSHYPTVYALAGMDTCKTKVKEWLMQAAVAFGKRDRTKILPSEQIGSVPLVQLDYKQIKEAIDSGCMKGICILGGGSNLKVTQDVLICEAAVKLGAQDILCLTYGNAAVTLGKYGFLEEGSKEKAGIVAETLGKEKAALAYCVGSEEDVVKIIDLVQQVGGNKVVALYPELTTAKDVLAAFALAGEGAQVFTAVRLPIDGSSEAAKEISQYIRYEEASTFTDKALDLFGC